MCGLRAHFNCLDATEPFELAGVFCLHVVADVEWVEEKAE
jgi:hypothetical protein